MPAAIDLPSDLGHSVRQLGEAGQTWMRELPELLNALEQDWGIAVGASLGSGNTAYLAEALTDDGRRAVLKIGLPPGIEGFTRLERELEVLLAVGGDPYVGILAHDHDRRVVLLERLGRPLHETGRSFMEQLAVITATLARGWRRIAVPGLVVGDDKARWLGRFIARTWDQLDRPCSEAVVARAMSYAEERARLFNPETAVLIHGDAHSANVLEVPGPESPSEFRLIDPEGLLSEPAHDLAIPLRTENAELLAANTVAMARARLEHVARISDVDAASIWEWSYIERVSTGLFLLQLDHEAAARRYLGVAERLVGVEL